MTRGDGSGRVGLRRECERGRGESRRAGRALVWSLLQYMACCTRRMLLASIRLRRALVSMSGIDGMPDMSIEGMPDMSIPGMDGRFWSARRERRSAVDKTTTVSPESAAAGASRATK